MGKAKIYLILFLVVAAWGFNVTATKILVTNFTPVTMTAARIFVAGVFVFIFLTFMKRVRRLTKREWRTVAIASLFSVVGHQYFLSVGLTETTASNGGMILGTVPLMTAIMAVIFLGDRLTWVRVVGFLLGITGVSFIVIIGNEGLSEISIGDVHVFLSVIAQAISFIIIAKASPTLDPRLLTGYMLVIGSIGLLGIGLVLEPNGLDSLFGQSNIGIWAIFLASAVIATALGHMFYNDSIGKVGPAATAIFLNLNPFFALISAVLFLDEVIGFAQVLGFFLILVGVFFGSGAYEEMRRKRRLKQA
ncbi:DMT family transporter [Allobacillus halotolerans]|uniref:DMT family transporter n=1 Tax=Allobacillus halotolerans TaxID=570278 RepID=A0ABS6GLT7_9BACI|nr:DMT family transporter [Allobacillus halotolerans]MBU6079930.1 DMT family transporter [Allobacillus halotolerans]